MSYAIKAEALSKEYRIGARQPLGGLLVDQLAGVLRHPIRALRSAFALESGERFWALKDLDFEVRLGEVFGVVGRNGAGKSTLLKILSRITDPTKGRALVRGRIASLLEVGTGFHPELSGRENIFLNATILGMRRREIERRFDEIVAFSGVERFLDTPVKHFSSGMYVRLAFSVAAHVEADMLLVDEVLAVGDAEFQKRCLGKMGEVAKGGRTVLFVSHNVTALRNLCTQGLLLVNGAAQSIGTIAEVLAAYGSLGRSGELSVELAQTAIGPADRTALVRRVSIAGGDASNAGQITVDTPFEIRIEIELFQPGAEVGAYLHCSNDQGDIVFSSGSFFEAALNGRKFDKGRHEFTCRIPAHLLNDGEYSLDVMLVRDRHEVFVSEMSVLSFRVMEGPMRVAGWNWRPVGVVRPALSWRHEPTGQ